MAIRTPPRPRGLPRRALLIDLDLLATDHGERLDVYRVRARLESVVRCAGEVSHVLAAARPGTAARYVGELATLRLPLATATSSARTPCVLLLERAQHLISVGYTEFVLVSGARRFTVLCGRTQVRTTVVCAQEKALSYRLRRMASRVVMLESP